MHLKNAGLQKGKRKEVICEKQDAWERVVPLLQPTERPEPADSKFDWP